MIQLNQRKKRVIILQNTYKKTNLTYFDFTKKRNTYLLKFIWPLLRTSQWVVEFLMLIR